MKQIGWYLPDSMRPERMSEALWEESRVITFYTLEDNGGWGEDFDQSVLLPLHIEEIA